MIGFITRPAAVGKTPTQSFDVLADVVAGPSVKPEPARQPGWGHRFLPRFKTVNGKRYQLHATRGWKCIGRVAA